MTSGAVSETPIVDPTLEKVVEYYDATVLDYKLVLYGGMHFGYYDAEHRTYPEAEPNMNRVLARMAGITSGTRVLDAGCGVGGSSIWLARHRGAQVTGITLSESQCRTAQQRADQQGVGDRTRFLVRDFSATDLPEDSFDVVWGLESVCHTDDKRTFLREARRLLRPDGTLIVGDGFKSRKHYEPRERKLLERWMRGWAIADLDTIDEFSESLEAVGFRQIEANDFTPHVMPFSRWLWRRSLLFAPIAYALRWLGLISRLQVDNGRSAICQYPALKRDLWRYMVFQARA